MQHIVSSGHNSRFLLRAVSLIIVFGLWELAGILEISFNFPTFSSTILALVKMIGSGELPRALILSFRSLLIGFCISASVGVIWGTLIATVGLLNWLSRPYFLILYGAPMAALIPILVLSFGIGLGAEVMVVILLSLPVVVLNTYGGIRNVDRTLVEMSRSFMASRWQIFIKILLPDALPMVMAGLRLGFSLGFVAMILAELMISPIGLGDLISYYSSRFRYDSLFAVVAAIMVVATLLLTTLKRLENRMLRWKISCAMSVKQTIGT